MFYIDINYTLFIHHDHYFHWLMSLNIGTIFYYKSLYFSGSPSLRYQQFVYGGSNLQDRLALSTDPKLNCVYSLVNFKGSDVPECDPQSKHVSIFRKKCSFLFVGDVIIWRHSHRSMLKTKEYLANTAYH